MTAVLGVLFRSSCRVGNGKLEIFRGCFPWNHGRIPHIFGSYRRLNCMSVVSGYAYGIQRDEMEGRSGEYSWFEERLNRLGKVHVINARSEISFLGKTLFMHPTTKHQQLSVSRPLFVSSDGVKIYREDYHGPCTKDDTMYKVSLKVHQGDEPMYSSLQCQTRHSNK
jgi:hypothetical protein